RVHRLGHRPKLRDLLRGAEEERLTRADRRAHRPLAGAGAVVAHVALHHDLPILVHLGNPERTCENAVAAGDAPRLQRRLHDAVTRPLDGVGGAHLGARGLLAVHADDRHRLDAGRAVDELEVNHGLAAMRVAFGAGLYARLASDAAVRI